MQLFTKSYNLLSSYEVLLQKITPQVKHSYLFATQWYIPNALKVSRGLKV